MWPQHTHFNGEAAKHRYAAAANELLWHGDAE
jgi:hypothetical protein